MSSSKAMLGVLAFLVLLFGSANLARADVVTIAANDTGWYGSNGFHDAANKNYIVGHCASCGGLDYHNYLTFNLSGVSGTVTGATIQIFNPVTAGAPGTYTLFDVSTPAGILMASNSGAIGIAIFNDLGSGSAYGSINVSTADSGTVITINLNAAAVAALNSTGGGTFAVGGFFTSPSAPSDSFVFGGSGTDQRNRLILAVDGATVPEPMTILLLGTGLAGLAGTVRRRRKK
jgi:hypothetical protein